MKVLALADPVEFFVGCALGLEKELSRELDEIRPLLLNEAAKFLIENWQLEPTKGGVTVQTSLIAGLQINYWSKIANRVLLRVEQFRAQSVPRLHARLKEASLKKYLGDKKTCTFKVEAHSCKVSNEKTVRRLAAEIWPVNEANAKTSDELQIFLRGFDDQWTLSIDTSGDHLHKRGYRKKTAAAPLRETLAALTIRRLMNGVSLADLARVQLIDPMAGSGTLLREAADLLKPNREREFSFLNFSNCPKLLKTPQFWSNYKSHPMTKNTRLLGGFTAIEQEKSLEEILCENLKESEATIKVGSFQSFDSRKLLGLNEAESRPLWVVTNPPYGERLDSLRWMKDFWPWVTKVNVDRLAIWIPENQTASFLKNAPVEPTEKRAVSNGGIPCHLLIFSTLSSKS